MSAWLNALSCCHGTAYIREIKYVLLKNSTDVPNEVTSKCINVKRNPVIMWGFGRKIDKRVTRIT